MLFEGFSFGDCCLAVEFVEEIFEEAWFCGFCLFGAVGPSCCAFNLGLLCFDCFFFSLVICYCLSCFGEGSFWVLGVISFVWYCFSFWCLVLFVGWVCGFVFVCVGWWVCCFVCLFLFWFFGVWLLVVFFLGCVVCCFFSCIIITRASIICS